MAFVYDVYYAHDDRALFADEGEALQSARRAAQAFARTNDGVIRLTEWDDERMTLTVDYPIPGDSDHMDKGNRSTAEFTVVRLFVAERKGA